MDVFCLVTNFERFPVVAFPGALVAWNVNVGQEMHFDLDYTISLARFAAASFDIKAEPTRLISTGSSFLRLREELSDGREETGISCRI